MAEMILYFSRAGENYVSGALKYLETGNTKIAAEMIGEMTGAELFEIRPAHPYSEDYNRCIEEARQEQKRDARPELAEHASLSLAGQTSMVSAGDQAWGAVQSEGLSGLTESRMAELLINGSSMGIIELTKKLGDYADAGVYAAGEIRVYRENHLPVLHP